MVGGRRVAAVVVGHVDGLLRWDVDMVEDPTDPFSFSLLRGPNG